MIARLTSWLRRRYEVRQRRDRERVAAVLRRHPNLSGGEIARLAYLNVGRAYVALAAMEYDGQATSRWVDGPYPRRRLYLLAGDRGAYCPNCVERCEGQHGPCDVDGRCRKEGGRPVHAQLRTCNEAHPQMDIFCIPPDEHPPLRPDGVR